MNPDPLSSPRQKIPVFTMTTEVRSSTLEKEREVAIASSKLVNVKERKIQIDTITGLKIEGVVNPNQPNYNARFKKGSKIKYVIFILDGSVYTFIGDVTEQNDVYEQMLTSFKILDKNQEQSFRSNFLILDFQECMPSREKITLLNGDNMVEIKGLTGKWNDLCSFTYKSTIKSDDFTCDIPSSWAKQVFRINDTGVDFSSLKQICAAKLNSTR